MYLNLKGKKIVQYFLIKNEDNKIQQYGGIISILKIYIRLRITYFII